MTWDDEDPPQPEASGEQRLLIDQYLKTTLPKLRLRVSVGWGGGIGMLGVSPPVTLESSASVSPSVGLSRLTLFAVSIARAPFD
jgi:hypothetical protein